MQENTGGKPIICVRYPIPMNGVVFNHNMALTGDIASKARNAQASLPFVRDVVGKDGYARINDHQSSRQGCVRVGNGLMGRHNKELFGYANLRGGNANATMAL